jgi:hypothetical protein
VENGWTSVVSPENMSSTPEDVRVLPRADRDVVVLWQGAPSFPSDWDADGGPVYPVYVGGHWLRALTLRSQIGSLDLEITAPNNGALTSNSTVWVSGRATLGATLLVAGSLTEIAPDGTFGVWVNLTLGANTISAQANRAGWLPASDAVTITRVAAPPDDSLSPATGGTALAVSPPDFFVVILLLLALLGALAFARLQMRRPREGPNLHRPRP